MIIVYTAYETVYVITVKNLLSKVLSRVNITRVINGNAFKVIIYITEGRTYHIDS